MGYGIKSYSKGQGGWRVDQISAARNRSLVILTRAVSVLCFFKVGLTMATFSERGNCTSGQRGVDNGGD